jgi:hypothetical protein
MIMINCDPPGDVPDVLVVHGIDQAMIDNTV